MNAVIEVRRDGPGFMAAMDNYSAPGKRGEFFDQTILGAVDQLKRCGAKYGIVGTPQIKVTDGIKAEYIAECKKEQAQVIAAKIQESLEFMPKLTSLGKLCATSELSNIAFRAQGQVDMLISGLEKELKSMGYTYDEESEEAVKIEEDNV